MKNILKEIKYWVEKIIAVFSLIGVVSLIALMVGIVILSFVVIALGLWKIFIYLI